LRYFSKAGILFQKSRIDLFIRLPFTDHFFEVRLITLLQVIN